MVALKSTRRAILASALALTLAVWSYGAGAEIRLPNPPDADAEIVRDVLESAFRSVIYPVGGFTTSGPIRVERASGKGPRTFRILLPDLNWRGGTDGLAFGSVELHATIEDAKRVAFIATVPAIVRISDASGRSVGRIEAAGRKAEARWDRELLTFDLIKLELSKLFAVDERTPNSRLQLGALRFDSSSRADGAAQLADRANVAVEDLELRSPDATLKASRLIVKADVAGIARGAALEQRRARVTGSAAKPAPTMGVVPGAFGTLAVDVNGSGIEMSGKGGDPVSLRELSARLGARELDRPKSRLDLTYHHGGLTIGAAAAALQTAPPTLDFKLRADDYPTVAVFETLSRLNLTDPANAGDFSDVQDQLTQRMAEARTRMTIEDLSATYTDASLQGQGDLRFDVGSALLFAGQGRLRARNLGRLLGRFAVTGGETDPLRTAIRRVAREESSSSGPLHVYDLSLDPGGNFTINGRGLTEMLLGR